MVRCIDNFSTGNRGAGCAEVFANMGYAVIFMHRKGSLEPWKRKVQRNVLDCIVPEGELWVVKENIECWKEYQRIKELNLVLSVEFQTVQEYMFMLRSAAIILNNSVGNRGMLFLAAAVSDFYIPLSKMTAHKIQSNNQDSGLDIHLDNVPKALGHVRHIWAPNCFIVTFKLETDPLILREKVEQSFSKYNQHAIVANLLQTRFTDVEIYANDISAKNKETQYYRISSSSPDELNDKLVRHIIKLHEII
jgi:phosphopantothenate-cysteine ligase